MKYFTADTHIGHANILEYCARTRPFFNIKQMEEAVIESINAQVGPGDVLYHLGDIGWKLADSVRFFDALRVKQIHVVLGNHDDPAIKKHPKVKSCDWFKRVKIPGYSMSLCHFPMLSWMGRIHLHGHWHCTGVQYHPWALDVGIDGMPGFSPWSELQIQKRAWDLASGPAIIEAGASPNARPADSIIS